MGEGSSTQLRRRQSFLSQKINREHHLTMRLLEAISSLLVSASVASSTILPRYANDTGYKLQTGPLDTPWTAEVGTNPWPEHPRPRVQRSQWKNLNGVWRWRNVTADQVNSPPTGQALERAG